MIAIVKTKLEDVPRILTLVDECRAFMEEQGFYQWTDGYPQKQLFLWDIEHGRGYVLQKDGQIEGFAALSFDEEACYKDIEGKWLDDEPYGVIHRMGVSKKVRGTEAAMQLLLSMELRCKARGITSVRIDTHKDNLPMQGLLKKAGYAYCGIVTYTTIPTGDPVRLAYQKQLKDCCCKEE